MLAESIPELQYATWQSKFNGQFIKTSIAGINTLALKPQSFMNLSGSSVQAAMHFFKCMPENLLVVHDDLELKYGEVAFKKGGGLGGHNGLKSISGQLGTKDYFRFRLGIGRPVHGSPAQFVLGRFTDDESIILGTFIENAVLKLIKGITELDKGSVDLNKHICA